MQNKTDKSPKQPSSNRGKANKRKGHGGETFVARLIRENTRFKHCVSTRSSSRLLDSCGVDLNFVPVMMQIKTGIHKGLKPADELEYMHTQLQKNLPSWSQERDCPKAVIHLKQGTPGKKRSEFQSLVTMSLDDFIKLLKTAYPDEPQPG